MLPTHHFLLLPPTGNSDKGLKVEQSYCTNEANLDSEPYGKDHQALSKTGDPGLRDREVTNSALNYLPTSCYIRKLIAIWLGYHVGYSLHAPKITYLMSYILPQPLGSGGLCYGSMHRFPN